jgi:hypothetical protein
VNLALPPLQPQITLFGEGGGKSFHESTNLTGQTDRPPNARWPDAPVKLRGKIVFVVFSILVILGSRKHESFKLLIPQFHGEVKGCQ